MAKKKGTAASDATATEDTESGTGKGKGKGKRILLLVGIVALLAALGAGAMFTGLIGGEDEAAAASPEATPTPTASELGMLVQLDSLTLNLQAGRFLKLGVAVELAPDVVTEPPTAPIYDEVIELFGAMTLEDLSVAAVRDQTKDQLLAALGEVYGDDIVGIYYTEFVMQ